MFILYFNNIPLKGEYVKLSTKHMGSQAEVFHLRSWRFLVHHLDENFERCCGCFIL